MISKNIILTVDTKLIKGHPLLPAMTLLLRWEREGKLKLVTTEKREMSFENRQPKSAKKNETTSPSLTDAAWVLFPGKDPKRLSMSELNHIFHLLQHHQSKNEIFVTSNRQEFIDNGRRERLLSSFGIKILTPEETVDTLKSQQMWE